MELSLFRSAEAHKKGGNSGLGSLLIPYSWHTLGQDQSEKGFDGVSMNTVNLSFVFETSDCNISRNETSFLGKYLSPSLMKFSTAPSFSSAGG